MWLALALPGVVLEMSGHLVGGHGWVDQTLSNWIQLVVTTPAVVWAGWPFFARGWRSLVTRNLNMFTLIGMGTGVAYVYSLVGILAPNIFPATAANPVLTPKKQVAQTANAIRRFGFYQPGPGRR